MQFRLILLLEIFLLLAGVCSFDVFYPIDLSNPFNPFDIVNRTDLSQQCLQDLTKFCTSLNTYVTTFTLCIPSGNCTKEQRRTLDENIYAIQQIDAFGRIPPALMRLTIISSGSYRECMELKAPYDVQYCYADAVLKNLTETPPGVTLGAKVAVCVPTSCVKQDMINFLNAANVNGFLPMSFVGASCVPKSNEYTTAFWIYMACMLFFVLWAISATIVDYALNVVRKVKVEGIGKTSIPESFWYQFKHDLIGKKRGIFAATAYMCISAGMQVFLSFSVYTNASILMDVRPPKQGTLKSLACVRFISMTWVVAGHILFTDASSDTLSPVLNMWNPLLSTTFINAFFSVDTFFVVSGVLVSYVFFKSKPSSEYVFSPFSWFLFYLHRYLRVVPIVFATIAAVVDKALEKKYIPFQLIDAPLWKILYISAAFLLRAPSISWNGMYFFSNALSTTAAIVANTIGTTLVMNLLTPPIMVFIGFYAIFNPMINGPWNASLMALVPVFADICTKYWWHNLLYINNLFDLTQGCYIITWYLAVDTQLYFVAPVFLITLFISPYAGFALIIICITGSIAFVYAVTLYNGFPAVLMGLSALERFTDFFSVYYQKPWARCSPYLVGLGAGYLLAMGKKPKLSKSMVVILWMAAAATGLACLYSPHRYIKGAEDWSEFVRGTYNNFSRLGWGLAVSWVIVANHWGWGGIIAKFMDHPLWQPLGRLSYCGYIVHFFIIRYIYNLDDRPAHFVSIWRSYVHFTIPAVVVSYAFAFFWSCLFEMPVIQLDKLLTTWLIGVKTDHSTRARGTVDVNNEEISNGGGAVIESKDVNNTNRGKKTE